MMLSIEIAISFLHFSFCSSFPSVLRLVGPNSVQICDLTHVISRFLVAALDRKHVPFKEELIALSCKTEII